MRPEAIVRKWTSRAKMENAPVVATMLWPEHMRPGTDPEIMLKPLAHPHTRGIRLADASLDGTYWEGNPVRSVTFSCRKSDFLLCCILFTVNIYHILPCVSLSYPLLSFFSHGGASCAPRHFPHLLSRGFPPHQGHNAAIYHAQLRT